MKNKPVLENNLAFGITYLNENVYFKIFRANCNECYLNLYHVSDPSYNKHIQMNKNGQVFSVMLNNFTCNDYEYSFEADGEKFVDSTVKVVHGRETFGVRDQGAVIRGGFLSIHKKQTDYKPLYIPYHNLIMYKLHVRGFTMHPSSEVEHPGTYQGIVEKIPYLKSLGINGLLLMPIMEFDELYQPKYYKTVPGKINYWGFHCDTFYYAPKSAFAADGLHPDREVKYMIQKLHENGIEVYLEMNFMQDTNPLMIADCLKFWHNEYQVDGFQLNLKEQYRSMIVCDSMLKDVKLFDATWNEAEIRAFSNGNMPNGLAEYNNNYLVEARRFLKGDESMVAPFMNQMQNQKSFCKTIHYLTNHDGFTLHDLYTYDIKHNENNGENNSDGWEYNYSWNCGVEGETRRKKINTLRHKLMKNAWAALLLSQGTPMILAGDEFGQTQHGNNNGYCQDNEITWLNWDLRKINHELFEFVQYLINLRNGHPVLHQDKMLRGMDYIYCGIPDLSFHGTKAWQPNQSYYSRELGVLLCGSYVPLTRRTFDSTFYIIYNMHWEPHEFDLPKPIKQEKWAILFTTDDTTYHQLKTEPEQHQFSITQNENQPINILTNQRTLTVPPRTVTVLVSINAGT